METFGERLRREREMRGISLDEIAAATKIGTRALKALEDQEFEKLPGGIFNKGFVRAYAKFLGIDEDQAVTDYLAAAGEPEGSTTEIDPVQLVAQRESEKKRPQSKEGRELASINASEKSGFPWLALIGLIVVLVAVGGGWRLYLRHKAQVSTPQASGQESPAAVMVPSAAPNQQETAPQPTPNLAPAGQSIATEAASGGTEVSQAPEMGSGFNLQIRAKRESWVSVTVDGKPVMSGTLEAADEKSFYARERVTLKTGNAGGVEIALDGKSLAPIGRDNEVRTVVFTPQGMQ